MAAIESFKHWRNTDFVGIDKQGECKYGKVLVKDNGFGFCLTSKNLLLLLVDIHKESMQFFLIDEHKQNKKNTSTYT